MIDEIKVDTEVTTEATKEVTPATEETSAPEATEEKAA